MQGQAMNTLQDKLASAESYLSREQEQHHKSQVNNELFEFCFLRHQQAKLST